MPVWRRYLRERAFLHTLRAVGAIMAGIGAPAFLFLVARRASGAGYNITGSPVHLGRLYWVALAAFGLLAGIGLLFFYLGLRRLPPPGLARLAAVLFLARSRAPVGREGRAVDRLHFEFRPHAVGPDAVDQYAEPRPARKLPAEVLAQAKPGSVRPRNLRIVASYIRALRAQFGGADRDLVEKALDAHDPGLSGRPAGDRQPAMRR